MSRVETISVECPECLAEAGDRCRRPDGRIHDFTFHQGRYDIAVLKQIGTTMSVFIRIAVADEQRPAALRNIRIDRITNTEPKPLDTRGLEDVVSEYRVTVVSGASQAGMIEATFEHRYGDDQYVLFGKAMKALEERRVELGLDHI
jgi:hypothetical protein